MKPARSELSCLFSDSGGAVACGGDSDLGFGVPPALSFAAQLGVFMASLSRHLQSSLLLVIKLSRFGQMHLFVARRFFLFFFFLNNFVFCCNKVSQTHLVHFLTIPGLDHFSRDPWFLLVEKRIERQQSGC